MIEVCSAGKPSYLNNFFSRRYNVFCTGNSSSFWVKSLFLFAELIFLFEMGWENIKWGDSFFNQTKIVLLKAWKLERMTSGKKKKKPYTKELHPAIWEKTNEDKTFQWTSQEKNTTIIQLNAIFLLALCLQWKKHIFKPCIYTVIHNS